jgi:DNA alkylation repair enzyme
MASPQHSPAAIAAEIRHLLQGSGSAEHAAGVQWFFKDAIKSHGWYTAELRKTAVRYRRKIQAELGFDFLLKVADDLFAGRVLEEKIFAVFLLERLTDVLGDAEFRLIQSWLSRIVVGPITAGWSTI